jgi:uncharacterized membrane protein
MSLPIDLPAISIPEIPLPIEIPEIIHPAIVHFAIAIPVVIFLLEIYNLAAKRRTISAFSLFLLIVVAVTMIGAYLTGAVDGKATWDILSSEGQTDLKAHKLLGIYLVYASLVLVVLKLLVMAIRKTVLRILFILILGGFIALTLFQGKEGGELVYKYGANSERVVDMKSDGDDASEELEEANEKLSELQEKYDELVASKKDETVKEESEEKAPEEEAKEEKAPEASAEDKNEEAESNETAPSSDTNSSN